MSKLQLIYSPAYNNLVLKNSASAIATINLGSKATATHPSNWNFTDMSIAPGGRYVFAADYGGENIGYGTPANQHYVHRLDLATGAWEAKTAHIAGNIQAVSDSQFILKSRDQWVTFTNNSWGTGNAVVVLNSSNSSYYAPGYYPTVYSGDFRYDSNTGRLLHGNSGSSSQEIQAFTIVNNDFHKAEGSGMYGSAQGYGANVTLATDGSAFYYGRLQVDPLDVTHNLRVFPEPIYAATKDVAYGNGNFYDAHTGVLLGSLGFSTTVYGLNSNGKDFWAYDQSQNKLRHFSPPAPDIASPSVPTALTGTAFSATQINLSWTASTDNAGVAGYKVYRNGVQVGNAAGAIFSDTGLSAETTYSYTVAACDAAGNCSAQSNAVSVATPVLDATAPAVPTGLTVSAVSATQVTLSWTAATDNIGVTSYKLYRNGVQTGTPTSTSLNDSGLSAGTAYSYAVAACDAAGNCSAQSSSLSVTTPVPDVTAPTVPTGLNASQISGTQINLTWTASTDNVGVAGYKVYRSGVQVGTPTSTSFVDTGLTVATTYSYKVVACDAAGNCSAQSAAASATTAAPVTAALVSGWNLVGNGMSGTINVASTFNDSTKISTVWKWVPATGTTGAGWAFYAPTLADGGAAYATSKGYSFLQTINGGEGFWVNAKVPFSFTLPPGTAITTASFQDALAPTPNSLPSGWSLIAVGSNPAPRTFVNGISLNPPATDAVAATSLTTLWAWYPGNGTAQPGWYFYAPSLDNSGGLGSYITLKGYLDFGTNTLTTTTGFWVNHP